nr:unnamed protein product [Callosobruchus chinensis]
MISTCHKHEMVKVITRRGSEKMKPKCILDYNAHTSAVDRADQMMSYYSSPRKTIRWYRKVFFHLIDICLWNACFLYKKRRTKKTLLEFRDDVLMELLNPQLPPKPHMVIDSRSHHFPAENVEKHAMKRCRWCSRQNIKKTIKVPLSTLRRTAWAMCCSMLQGMASNLIFLFVVFTVIFLIFHFE